MFTPTTYMEVRMCPYMLLEIAKRLPPFLPTEKSCERDCSFQVDILFPEANDLNEVLNVCSKAPRKQRNLIDKHAQSHCPIRMKC